MIFHTQKNLIEHKYLYSTTSPSSSLTFSGRSASSSSSALRVKFGSLIARVLGSDDEALWQVKFPDHLALFGPHLARVALVIVA